SSQERSSLVVIPCPSEKGSCGRLKNVRRSRKWLMDVLSELLCRSGCRRFRGHAATSLDLVQETTWPRVHSPGHDDTGDVEQKDNNARRLRSPRQRVRRAVALRNEQGAVGSECRSEPKDGGTLLFGLAQPLRSRRTLHQALHLFAHDGGDHLECRGVTDA